MLPTTTTKLSRAVGPIAPAIKAHLPAVYPAISRVVIPTVIEPRRYKSSAPVVKAADPATPLSRFFDLDDDFFRPTFTRPSELMHLSKLLDAERDWFNQHYLNSLNAFKEFDKDFPSSAHFKPGYQLSHDEKNVQIAVDLPGVKMDDVNVELTNDDSILHIYGGRKTESDGKVEEIKFDKRFSLGEEIDKEALTANLQDGVLTVTAPKVEVEEKAIEQDKVRKIPITAYDPSLDG